MYVSLASSRIQLVISASPLPACRIPNAAFVRLTAFREARGRFFRDAACGRWNDSLLEGVEGGSYRPRADCVWDGRKTLIQPREAADIFAAILGNEPVEVFGVLCLTTKHRPICYHELSRGTLDASLIHPRELFKAAFMANAAAVVIAHNHPSGDPEPSPDDIALTERLVAVGRLLGVAVIDHIVIGDRAYYSFKEGGRL